MLANACVVRTKLPTVEKVGKDTPLKDWTEEDCRHVGRSLSSFVVTTTTPAAGVAGWKLNYHQLNQLFENVTGFEVLVLAIAEGILRKSKVGVIYRVGLGAFLSTTDAASDLYVIATYYKHEALRSQANALLVMLASNLFLQLVFCLFDAIPKVELEDKIAGDVYHPLLPEAGS